MSSRKILVLFLISLADCTETSAKSDPSSEGIRFKYPEFRQLYDIVNLPSERLFHKAWSNSRILGRLGSHNSSVTSVLGCTVEAVWHYASAVSISKARPKIALFKSSLDESAFQKSINRATSLLGCKNMAWPVNNDYSEALPMIKEKLLESIAASKYDLLGITKCAGFREFINLQYETMIYDINNDFSALDGSFSPQN